MQSAEVQRRCVGPDCITVLTQHNRDKSGLCFACQDKVIDAIPEQHAAERKGLATANRNCAVCEEPISVKARSDTCRLCREKQKQAEKDQAKYRRQNFRSLLMPPSKIITENPTPDDLVRIVADYYGVDPEKTLKDTRINYIMRWVRQVAIYLASNDLHMPYEDIASSFKMRKVMVIHAYRTAANYIQQNHEVAEGIESIRTRYVFTNTGAAISS